MAVTPTSVEVYENGEEFKVYDIETEHVDERMFDVRMIVKPAEHELHHNRHTEQGLKNLTSFIHFNPIFNTFK